ncbi:lysophospholipase [Photobacterium sagamiensis]|uniref:alpha/beta hydrolase n=1 Tax=Photobacterium sagamiensis TaxID=2910241 RepID=UPI003D0C7D8A
MRRLLTLLIFSVLITGCVTANERESPVCGVIKERFMFWLWSSSAPEPDESRVNAIEHVENIEFTTSDNKKLNGYVYLAHNRLKDEEQAKGYILMALGNAMISDQMIGYLSSFAEKGYDVYIYDYRGYGSSEGKRRINAIIEDYKEIIVFLNNRYDRHLLYGISLGGAVIMNAIGSGVQFDRAVIDSSPSRFSPFGCPEQFDPINNLPEDSKNILVITGQLDRVLKPELTSELRIAAGNRNARVFDGNEYDHPFMDKSQEVHKERMAMIIKFLSGQAEEN